ncbi:MAG: methyltransferase domain-containing protein [Ruminococcus flavefaciens]|nr:methyltransferase domain-containing protein [Ruminococcus flavefaciens]
MKNFEKTFDTTATDYDKIRPTYVKEIYEDIFHCKQINQDSHVLEIGMGTGKATQPILDTHCHFVGIEPGENLAALAKEKLRKYANFSCYNLTLQDYICADNSFDLVYAATAFHWIPEEYGYRRVYNLLKSGGVFARFAYHAGADKGRRELTDEIQELYRKYMDQENPPAPFSDADAKRLADKALAYGFVDVKHMLYHTTKDFTAAEYISLLKTYPDHMKLKSAVREKLFEGIFHAIADNGGIMTVYYTMALELAIK